MKIPFLLFSFFLSFTCEAQIPPPYSQDFEGAAFPPTGWQTFPIGSAINWHRDTTASGHGASTACISFDNFNTAAGSYYGVRLPSMNFSGATQPYLQFDYAYALRTGTASDIFGIWWSNNGSSNWVNVINYSGANLVTAPSTSSLFVPTASQWQTKTLSLNSLAGLSFVRLAIEDDCNHGNKIYIDNMRVFDSTAVGVTELFSMQPVRISPNPFTDKLSVYIEQGASIQKAELFDCLGKLVRSVSCNSSELSLNDLSSLTEGVYFLQLHSADGKIICRKIMKTTTSTSR